MSTDGPGSSERGGNEDMKEWVKLSEKHGRPVEYRDLYRVGELLKRQQDGLHLEEVMSRECEIEICGSNMVSQRQVERWDHWM